MRLMTLIAAALVISFGSVASAAPCRDGKGKFVTCPPVAAAKKCRDAKGKFIKCDAAASTAAAH